MSCFSSEGKVINYYPYISVGRDGFVHTIPEKKALNAALHQQFSNLPKDIVKIVIAYLLTPTQDQQLVTLSPQNARKVLDEELRFSATMTSKMAQEYLRKYRTFANPMPRPQEDLYNLKYLGEVAPDVEQLYVRNNELQHLDNYQQAFPRIKRLVLEGDLPPAQTLTINSSLEELNIFALRSKIPATTFNEPSSLSRVIFCSEYNTHWESGMSDLMKTMTQNYISKMKVSAKVESDMLGALSAREYRFEARSDSDSQPFYEEWELNKRLNNRGSIDLDLDLGQLPSSPYFPLSQIRDLVLDEALRCLPPELVTIVSDYFIENVPLCHLLGLKTPEECKILLKLYLRQTTSLDLEQYQCHYKKMFGEDISLEEMIKKSPQVTDFTTSFPITSRELRQIVVGFRHLEHLTLEDCSKLSSEDIKLLTLLPRLKNLCLDSANKKGILASQLIWIRTFLNYMRPFEHLELKERANMSQEELLKFNQNAAKDLKQFSYRLRDKIDSLIETVLPKLPIAASPAQWIAALKLEEESLLKQLDD